MGYSVEPRDRVFVKGYRFLSFAKNMGRCICIIQDHSEDFQVNL